MNRYICIHGHFYQPPRENPWLEEVELQDSAYPFHDWNERITAECYAANGASRIMDSQNLITDIVNNYSKISFNFGPTLLSWMESHQPETYKAILEADQQSIENFSGHGSAIAQAYNHMIMPLANKRDKYTQILWGIEDFKYRFGRKPEGMWLPETAVSIETLDILAKLGIKFTILGSHQAYRTRKIGSRTWQDKAKCQIDSTMAYQLSLPGGKKITIFFYDGPISQSIAFEGLLASGEDLANRLISAFNDERDWDQIVNIATDGETYGHHHRFGDMALAYALHHIEYNKLAQLTNYGEYLEKHQPTHEVSIHENTSWSCTHGIERWRSNCGCNSGMHQGWHQEWRSPLREALDWLRDTLAPKYEEKAKELLHNPWKARDDYIMVVVNRSPDNIKQFINKHANHHLDEQEVSTALKLLELQRHAMLMYTSCGWFFDDLSGIETVQIIQYASRAIQISQGLFGNGIEAEFTGLLEKAQSNILEYDNGTHIYEEFVKPAMLDWDKIAAHYAVSSLFEDYGEDTRIFCYAVHVEEYKRIEAGRAKFAIGRARFISQVTQEYATLTFGILHFGDHNVSGGVRQYSGEESDQLLEQDLAEPFSRADLPEIIRLMDKHFGDSTYSIRSLFCDEQRKVLNQVLESSLVSAEGVYRQLYEHQAPLMRFLIGIQAPVPKAFSIAAEFFLNADLRRAIGGQQIDIANIKRLLDETSALRVELDIEGLGYLFTQALERMSSRFIYEKEDLLLLSDLNVAVALALSSPFPVDLWKVQNTYFEILLTCYPEFLNKSTKGDQEAEEWIAEFITLGEHLRINTSY